MKVIFVKDVGGVGQRDTVKEVSDGYALNFLIAQGLAEQATKEKIAALEKRTKSREEEKNKEAAAREKIITALDGARVELSVRATEKGGLFKSVGAKEIVQALRKEGKEIDEQLIILPKPIKEVGEHTIEIAAGNTHGHLTVVVNPAP